MPDVFTKEKRSAVMAQIRGSGNRSTELRLAAFMRLHRITGWRRNQKLLGRPDFVFVRERLAVFVDGCFWHGCPTHYVEPRSGTVFWRAKIAGNKARDRKNSRLLKKLGWRVMRIWEHDLKKESRTLVVLRKIRAHLDSTR